MTDDLTCLAAFASMLADAARRKTLPECRGGSPVENKGAGTAFDPVTQADRAAERIMRDMIRDRYPKHGITGEEFPDQPAMDPYVWSLDPIDGTRAYICGLPSWGTLIALLYEGEPIFGLVDMPRLDERYIGFGDSALLTDATGQVSLATSRCRRLSDARISTTDPYLFAGEEAEAFDRLRRAARLTRFGLDCYAYARLAAGTLDLVAESGLKPHDYNAVVPIVRAAGGIVANWSGGTYPDTGQIVAAATEDLLKEACALLRD